MLWSLGGILRMIGGVLYGYRGGSAYWESVK